MTTARITHTMTVDGITSTRRCGRNGGHTVRKMIEAIDPVYPVDVDAGTTAQRWNPGMTVDETAWLTHGIVVDAHTGTANAMIPPW